MNGAYTSHEPYKSYSWKSDGFSEGIIARTRSRLVHPRAPGVGLPFAYT
jgi:hypothetical protein